MADLLLGSALTIAELRRRETPDGKLSDLIDVLNQENGILDYMTWIECNAGDYHEDKRTVSEPTGQLRSYDEGVPGEAGVTEVVLEPTVELASISEVDNKKYQRSADPDGYRMQEDTFFLRGMTKTFVGKAFDGNRSTDGRDIDGINNRDDYNTLSAENVYDNAGGNASVTANKTSVYFIQFGDKKVNMIFPRGDPNKGGMLPIKMQDFGLSIIDQAGTSQTRKYPAWQTWFDTSFGWFFHDPRCCKRIVNISTSNIDGVDDFAWHEDSMIDVFNQLEYNGANAAIFCNRTVLTQAQKRANEKGNAYFTMEMEGEGPFAKPVTRFMGIPMVRVDQIGNDQATVV